MLDALAETVRRVGARLLAEKREDAGRGEWRGTQLKAAIDVIAQREMMQALAEFAPGLPVISEEDAATHLAVRPDRYLIVDPVDGTASYAGGFDGYVTQVALIEGGRPTEAAIYAPALDLLYLAARGRGASCNGKPIHAAHNGARLTLIDNTPKPHSIAARLALELKATGYVESGSIALKICRVADGTADLFVKDVTVRDWDVAPGELVLAEAGGALSLPDGAPFEYDGAFDKPGLIAARDGVLAARARERRLVLSRVPDDFEAERDIPIGPSCFADAEGATPGWTEIPFIDPFASPDELAAAAADSLALFEALLPDVAADFNRRHGRGYSAGYWRLVTLSWLYRLIETTWARWRLIERIAASHAGERIAVTILGGAPDWRFRDYADFVFRGPMGDEYDTWLSSRVIEALQPAGWRITQKAFSPKLDRGRPIVAATGSVSSARRMLNAFWPRPRFDSVPDVDRATRLAFSAMLSIAPARPRVAPDFPAERSAHPFPESFVALIRGLMKVTMPESLGCDFVRHESESLASRYRPGRLYVGPINWTVERDVFMAAQAEEQREKVVSLQYGCNYGTALAFDFTAVLQYRRHAFLTWGWTQHRDYPGNFLPLPSPLLSRDRDNHRESEACAILVSTYCHTRFVRAVSLPQPAAYLRYRESKRDFIQGLDDAPRAGLAYRPYPHGSGNLEDITFVRRLLPDIREVSGALMPHLTRCRLMVIDHPGTTLYAALAANVPTVAYWEFDAWPLAPDVEADFRPLMQAGIVHRDPHDAAGHINEHWDDVGTWWRAASVQTARRQFCAKYARTSRSWRIDWARALWRLSANG